MKLSEAIRIGAALRPQAFHMYCGRNQNREMCTCALGGACEAATGMLPSSENFLPGSIIIAIEQVVGPVSTDLYNKILDWNDVDRLPREQIADLVEAEGL